MVLGDTLSTPGTKEGSDYIKFPNGTLICWGTKNVTTNASGGSGNGIRAYRGNATVTYPVAFNSTPSVCANVYGDQSAWWGVGAVSITAADFILNLSGDANNRTVGCNWMAVGRWKA